MKKFLNLKVLLITFLVLVVALPIIFWFSIPLINRAMGVPDLKVLEDYQPIGSIELYDYQDNFLGVLQGKEDRQVVSLNQMSEYAVKAVLAAEDNQFFRHHGFSLMGFSRAISKNIAAGKIVQGGSTLTQQMVKNLFINEDERFKKSYKRKVVELLISLEVERKYSKEKILETYLNQVYFGNLAYGLERAAQRYFSKPASKLTLVEGSYLASLLTAPSYLSQELDKAKDRQAWVLKRMLELGYITQDEYKEATEAELKFDRSAGSLSKHPYYFTYIEQQLKQRFTNKELRTLGLKVYTSLDPKAQVQANKYLTTGVRNAAYGIDQGALVTIDVDTAQVRALVGGVGDFWKHQYNRAVNDHTIGSGFKPFVYLTAFMQGIVDPDSMIEDTPLAIEDKYTHDIWTPQNFDHEFHGPITVKAALIFSRNIPAIKIASRAGLENIIETARTAGLDSKMKPYLPLALGAFAFSPLEVANAYSTLARGGIRIDPIVIRYIKDADGRIRERNVPTPVDALPQRDVATLVEVMRDVVKYGSGALANIPGRDIAGKTGTADGARDIWFTGFTPDTVTTVWAGNDRNKEVASRYATGGSTPAWIWREYMKSYYRVHPQPATSFLFTNYYREYEIDPLTGLLANEYTPNPVMRKFIPGTEPKEYAPIPNSPDIRSRKQNIFQEKFHDFKKKLRSIEDDKVNFIEKVIKRNERPKPKPKFFF